MGSVQALRSRGLTWERVTSSVDIHDSGGRLLGTSLRHSSSSARGTCGMRLCLCVFVNSDFVLGLCWLRGLGIAVHCLILLCKTARIVDISVYTCCLHYVLACEFLRAEPSSLVMPLPGSAPHLEWVLNQCLWDEWEQSLGGQIELQERKKAFLEHGLEFSSAKFALFTFPRIFN